MYCKMCGTKNDDDSLYCVECGHKFNKRRVNEPEPKPVYEEVRYDPPTPPQAELPNDRGSLLMSTRPKIAANIVLIVISSVLVTYGAVFISICFGRFISALFYVGLFCLVFGILMLSANIRSLGIFKKLYVNAYENRIDGKCFYTDSPKQIVYFDFAYSEIDAAIVNVKTVILSVKGVRHSIVAANASLANQLAGIINSRNNQNF